MSSALRRYYEAHEDEYVKRLARGQVGWDEGAYDNVFMRSFVARTLAQPRTNPLAGRALDLGCGTGALSCWLAQAGFIVTGVDISRSAIDFARQEAKRRGLRIDFHMGDVCRWAFPQDTFDLIIDGHLLHYLVDVEDRRRLLSGVQTALTSSGEFWMETMLLDPHNSPPEEWHLDEEGISWTRVADASGYVEAVERGGVWWLPARRIAKSAEWLLHELDEAGLRVVWHEVENASSAHATAIFRARCKR